MKNISLKIFGGKVVHSNCRRPKMRGLMFIILMAILSISTNAFAQGSIFGVVANSDLSTPTNGQVSFVGYLDNTDEEIRLESSVGAGYDAGNWFDDFQNYLTEAPGNPYDYVFYNATNGQGFQLSALIPNNSFQQENVLLGPVIWPSVVTGLSGSTISSSSVLLRWNGTPGLTYHVYRRAAISNGSFFRLDNPAGVLTDPGVPDSFYVDSGVDGVSSYDYVLIAEDASGNWSAHSAIITVNSGVVNAPVLASINPNSGIANGGNLINIYGSGFDPAGTNVNLGLVVVSATVLSPLHLTIITPAAAPGPVNVSITNVFSGQISNTLTNGFTYSPNAAPVLAVIGPQSTTEGISLQFVASATDADGDIPILTTTTLPVGASFTDSLNGNGLFSWAPGFLDAGIYNVTFYATDGVTSLLVDSEQVVITVIEAGNQLPVFAPVNDTSLMEGTSLALAVSATDPEAVIPILSTSALPVNAAFVDNGNGTGNLTFNPDFTQAGIYNISFYASDLIATDSIQVAVTVTEAGNQLPVLAAIGPQTVIEGAVLAVSVSATDAESIPVLSTSALPGTALFTDNGNGTGTFDWTPSFTDSGTYSVTFYASDGIGSDSELVVITVTGAGNQIPVLVAIGPQSVTENVLLTFGVTASDADGTIPALSTTALPAGALFVDNANGTGSFNWTPAFTDAGIYNVTFYASDGIGIDSEQVVITVIDAGNQLPVLAVIGPQPTTENVLLTFIVSATDAESIPALTTSALPAGASFIDSANGSGLFNWTPGFTQAGIYLVTFYASDGAALDSEIVTITVADAGNQIPVLAAIGPQGTTENVQLLFGVSATDADAAIPLLSTSTLPVGAVFTDNVNGTGLFDWTPGFSDAGIYNVTFYASDGFGMDSEQVVITVVDAGNQTPILAAIGPQTGMENILLTFPVSAVDPEGAIPILTTSALPVGAVFTDSANGAGLFNWTPDFTQSGTYNITFYASDGVATDSELVTFAVAEAGNQPPMLTLIGNQVIVEGAQLVLGITAIDPESIPILTTSALPTGATFIDSANGSGLFDWTPGFTQAGTYLLTFYASDGVAVDSEQIIITVSEAGAQAPVVTAVPDTSVNEGNVLSIVVTAVDPDGGAVFITANHRLNNFTFVDSGNGTAVLTYSPDFFDGGIDSVVFLATDFDTPQQSGQAITVINTIETNQPPTFELIGPQNVEVNKTLSLIVRAQDSTDANILHLLYLSALNLPANATFIDNNDKTATFTFTPLPGQEGVDTVTFVVTDQGVPQLTTNMSVVITVQATNSLPVMVPIGPQTILEGNTLTLNLSAADPDGNIPYFTVDTSNLEGNATFVDNGDGTALFTFTPSFVQAGLAYVTFFAHDGIGFVKEVVLIQIYEAGDQPPVFDPLPSPSVTEGLTGTALVTAHDPDTLPVTIYLVDAVLPANFSFFDSGNGSSVITMAPDFTQSGVYIITLGVSDGTLADTSTIAVTVIDGGNQMPVLAPISDYSTNELVNLTFGITSSDLDGIPVLSMSSGTLPVAATLTDNGNGTGTFSWMPGNFDSGTHAVMFYATDDTDPLLVDSQQVFITVNDVNQLPISFFPFGQADTVSEGDTIRYSIVAQDPDSTIPIITAFLDGTDSLATNMVLDSTYIDVANNWRVSVLTFAPDFSQGAFPLPAMYQIRFKICDVVDTTLCNTTAPVVFKVYNKNQPPQLVFQPNAGPFTISEGASLQVTVTAVDDEGFASSLIARNLPANATFTGALSYRKTFNFSPDFLQAGIYQVTFAALDNMGDSVVQSIDITVLDAGNQAPVITNVIGDTTIVFIGDTQLDTILAVDPELDSTELTAVVSSPNMAFSWTGSGGTATGIFTFAPGLNEAFAIFQVMFIANDFPGATADTAITYYRVVSFMRGDSDSDFQYTMNDIVYLIKYLFNGGQAPNPIDVGDVDGNGAINVADVAYMVNFMYGGGPPPPQ